MNSYGQERDRVTLALAGQMVVSHRCQGTVVLTMMGGDVVVLEAPFTVTTPEASRRYEPAVAAETEVLAGELVGQTIESCTIDDAGSLTLTFTSGIRVLVEPDDRYEAWTVSGPAGMLVVCTPGGKLAVWRGVAGRSTRTRSPRNSA
jgi:hypothetical protein